MIQNVDESIVENTSKIGHLSFEYNSEEIKLKIDQVNNDRRILIVDDEPYNFKSFFVLPLFSRFIFYELLASF